MCQVIARGIRQRNKTLRDEFLCVLDIEVTKSCTIQGWSGDNRSVHLVEQGKRVNKLGLKRWEMEMRSHFLNIASRNSLTHISMYAEE